MSAVLDVHARPVMAPALSVFAHAVLEGLARPRKSLAGTWPDNHGGLALFDEVAEGAETLILERCVHEIARAAGPGVTVMELGGRGSRSTLLLLLQALDRPAGQVAAGASAQCLADFTRLTRLPDTKSPGGRRLVFLPGPTIGHFAPEAATGLLIRIARAAGPKAMLVVGADATHDPAVLVPACNDARGVMEAFHENLLARINRELNASFSLSAFQHQARWNAAEQRLEMHLVSRSALSVAVLGRQLRFAMGESILTRGAYKHGLLKFRAMAARAGWEQTQLWTGGQHGHAVHVFESADRGTSQADVSKP